MFALEFDGALFQFDAREPEFAPFVHSPPKIAARHIPDQPPLFTVLIQAPNILPTSATFTAATRC